MFFFRRCPFLEIEIVILHVERQKKMISMISADPSENLNENSRIDRFKENQKNEETILGGRDGFNFLKREKSSH